MRTIVNIDNKTIKKAYDLCMKGLTPIEIKEALKLNQNEWEYINRSSYYHSLLFRPTNQERVEDNLAYIKGVELMLFNAFSELNNCGQYSDRHARLNKQINELKTIYSNFNIYN